MSGSAAFSGFLLLAATVLPLAWLSVLLAAGRAPRALAPAIAVSLAAAAFLFAHVHESTYTGLDDSCYAACAEALAGGRPLRARDDLLASLPRGVRRAVMPYSNRDRGTRDLAFRTVSSERAATPDIDGDDTVPWFQPALPLAAAAFSRCTGLPVRFFVPLAGSLWALALFLALSRSAGWRGLACAAAVLLATPWPAWFLRGTFPEAVAGVLVSAAVLAALCLRRRSAFAVGFLLGLSAAFHRSAGLLGVALLPVFALREARLRRAAACAAGGAAGLAVSVHFLFFVSNTYGRDLLGGTPLRSRVLSLAVPALLVAGTALGALVRLPRVRDFLLRPRVRAILLAAAAAACVAVPACCAAAGGPWAAGLRAVATGLSPAAAPALLLAAAGVFLSPRRYADKAVLAAAVCLSPAAFFVLGDETLVGVWNLRRALPNALVAAPVLALGSAALAGRAARLRAPAARRAAQAGLLLAALGAVSVPLRFPAPYRCVGERGARALFRGVEAAVRGSGRLVLFDYLSHAAPHAVRLENRVLGLPWRKAELWPELFGWAAAGTDTWAIATSWAPPALEDGVRLVPRERFEAELGVVRGASFLGAAPASHDICITWLEPESLAPGETPAQDKTLDGGPLALRGPWDAFRRKGGQWARQGAGLVGPVPAPGGGVRVVLDAGWWTPRRDADWTAQTVRVRAPWGAEAAVSVPAGGGTVEARLPGPDAPAAATGVYSFAADRPYDPSLDGLGGYPADLAVFLRRVRIEPEEPAAP
ncbi:MAG: hypothetical protein IJV65_02000 [Kiritimatiellae bacterium]|nr:hypothetical protein [Kiritimatiellia bacterium]